jgi:hypothetical protein
LITQPTLEELRAAEPHVLDAPKDGGTVEMLCFRPGFNKRDFVDSLSLTQSQGVPGERWEKAPWLRLQDGRPHPGIQVSILPRRVLDLVWRDRDTTPHPGDTFICDLDMTEANLPEGQMLQVGSAVLRVSDVFNDGCVKWKARYGKPAYDWVRAPENRPFRLRGILCSIESDGIVRNGDPVTVLR